MRAPTLESKATKQPLPWRVTITPSRSSSRYARFTVITLTPISAANCRIDGIACPMPQSPIAMRCFICSMIWRYIGRLSVCEMTNICTCTVYTEGSLVKHFLEASGTHLRHGGDPRRLREAPEQASRNSGSLISSGTAMAGPHWGSNENGDAREVTENKWWPGTEVNR